MSATALHETINGQRAQRRAAWLTLGQVEAVEALGRQALRYGLVLVLLWIGGMKFTGYEAKGIAPFIANSPIMSWLHVLFGVQGANYVIGVLELATAIALIAGAFNPIAIGAAA